MAFVEFKKPYPKRDPHNLSVFLIYVVVVSKIGLFSFVSKCESLYKSISLLTLSEKDLNLSILHHFYDQNNSEKNDSSAGVNVLYLQSPSYNNKRNSNSLENYV